ncbi:MAG: translation initiation factor IF-2 [Bacteroidales bacterium]|nr:translation initiation factor IF-2 [Bacteroidales bacterium]
MAEGKRLSKVARECNVGISTIVEFLSKKGFEIDSNPNVKIPGEALEMVYQEYQQDQSAKRQAEQFIKEHRLETRTTLSLNDNRPDHGTQEQEQEDVLLIQDTSAGTDMGPEPEVIEKESVPDKKEKTTEAEEIIIEIEKPKGPKVVGKVDLKKKTTKKKKEEKEKKTDKETEEKAEEEKKEVIEEQPVITQPEKKEEEELTETTRAKDLISEVKVVGKIELDSMNLRTRPARKSAKEKREEREKAAARSGKKQPAGETRSKETKPYRTKSPKLDGPTVVGKIDLSEKDQGDRGKTGEQLKKHPRKKRKRIRKDRVSLVNGEKGQDHKKWTKVSKKISHKEVNQEDVEAQIKSTMAQMEGKGKSKASKHRREKRDAIRQSEQKAALQKEADSHILKVTEFVTANELSSLMNIPVNDIIAACMSLGLFVSINQRLDAETITLVADEYNYEVEFISVNLQDNIEETDDLEEDLVPRPPIVTVMGHVDHGKTSLLDYIRKTNIIAGEAGGITQHIGAYKVVLEDQKTITFLDTPGHEAFTAMRARGAQVTDIAIIVIAADDAVMPQTIEAINHASAAGVPIVFAINKIDKEGAQPEKIREQLANMNYLVEDWGGKYQVQEISAKKGIGINELLEKVLLEAELLELKANPNRRASGSVIESALDRGRGYVTTLLVQTGTLKIGDIMLAGSHFGRVKAMFNERGTAIKEAGPADPVLVLGLNGAAQAGYNFNILESEHEAREIATKREILQREQESRTKKHITLDEIGRRIAIGNFQELNLIIKGDVDGSVEAIADAMIKLSTPEIQVNINHKAVGQISESDILLASASNAIVIGFQVRPSLGARRLAEKEDIEIRLYSIIYDAINEIKAAMEGMLSPEIKEEITGTLEVLDTFKITKVGTIAGCVVKDGKILRDSHVRVIRDGIVVYDGELGSLKRFKDEAKEVVSGLECGLNIENFNDIKVGDVIEAYLRKEVKKTL